jgi:hypothetical protein
MSFRLEKNDCNLLCPQSILRAEESVEARAPTGWVFPIGSQKKYWIFCLSADYSFSRHSFDSNPKRVRLLRRKLFMLSCDLRKLVAAALVLSTALVTMPLSAADFSTSKSVVGSVRAVGPVQLRGVGISQEGTLFAGDSIRADQKGHAKILLGTGSKIELSEKTDLNVDRDAQGVKIAMNTGAIGFSARTPLRIDLMPFEVTATDDASGNVAIISSNAAGVRVLNGKITVRNLKTSESFVLTKGQERLLGIQGGVNAPALAQVASNAPAPIPAPAPQTPAGKTSSGLAMDTGAWLAVVGVGALGGIAIWALVEAHNNQNDIDALKARLASPSKP